MGPQISSVGFIPGNDENNSDSADQSGESDGEAVEIPPNVRNILLPSYSGALDRGDIGDRFGALLATCLVKDLTAAGIITREGIVFGRGKIRSERKKARNTAIAATRCHDLLKCISFDGKKDKTLVQRTVGGEKRNIIVMEEHITMVKEPGSCFIGYAIPTAGSGAAIMEAMTGYLAEKDYCLVGRSKLRRNSSQHRTYNWSNSFMGTTLAAPVAMACLPLPLQ